MPRLLLVLALFPLSLPDVRGATSDAASDESEILFVRRVVPLLREKCLGCHGNDPDNLEGSLNLLSPESLRLGGDSGEPAVVPGNPDASPVYLAARRDHDWWSPMPPKDSEALNSNQLAWLRAWIASGAAWPATDRQQEIEAEFSEEWSSEDGAEVKTSGGLSSDWTHRNYDPAGLWAYQPVRTINLAALKVAAAHPVDALIEQSMPEGLELAPRADRRTLIRRATFDLTGLPPAPAEVEDFVTDRRSDQAAFAAVIERLLSSPHYGERMAQHWLDVVRYADSSGFANDFERGNAWRYRDYVIRSFDEDMPFDQFIREQIAGDEINPDNPEALVATGFLRMGPWELTGMEVAKVARQRFLDDVTNSVGETFLAHSLQCARCHDHKFDPVPTRDYYSIQAVFATTQLAERAAEFLPTENTDGFKEKRYLEKRRLDYQAALDRLDDVLLANAQEWYAQRDLSSQDWENAVRAASQKSKHGVFNAARNAMKRQGVDESRYPPKLVGFEPQEFGEERVARKGLQRLNWEFDRYKPFALAVYNGRTPQVVSVLAPTRVPGDRMSAGELEQTCILAGGDPFSPTEPVAPGVLSVLDDQIETAFPTEIAGRRLALANWIADAKNPLTTRVIANRVWQWHFGAGLAGNANNFGSTGKRPTHPQLLDWLAATLVADSWSIKSLHRRIMNSDVYCRSTQHPDVERLTTLDPLGESYAAFQPRRLSAEELRDAMLAASGELNPTVGGIPCRPVINLEVALQPRMVMGTFAAAWTPNPLPEQRNRRSIYVHKLRGLIDPMLEVFNSPGPDFSCERRESSIVTPQVFALFNGSGVHARALAIADRAVGDAKNDRQAVSRCFQRLLSRTPSEQELDEFVAHWRDVEQSLPETAEPLDAQPTTVLREAVEENTGEKFSFTERLYSNEDYVPDLQPHDASRHVRALADICLVMLNSNEFVYVY